MKNVKITLDPGHVKGYNVGINKHYVEGEAMFRLANYLKAELLTYEGFTVFITRDAITEDPSLTQRGQMAVNTGSEMFLSLHTNAASGQAYGVVLYRSVQMAASQALGESLANAIANRIKKDVPKTYSRGCLTRPSTNYSYLDYYGVLRHSVGGNVKYSYIIEHAFHSTTEECAWLDNENHLKELAVIEAKIIADFYGNAKKSSTTETPTSFTYVTKDGDTMESIIAEYYKAAATYVDANKLKLMAGQSIVLPINENYKTNQTEPEVNDDYINHTVVWGDTYYLLAQKYLGNGMLYPQILTLNNITVNHVINPGDVIKIPKTATTTPTTKTYTVKYGDSWWGIAASQLGNGTRYKELATYNGMTISMAINPGMTLKIPQ